MHDKIFRAIKDLKNGRPVLIFDFENRERETDIVFLAEVVDYKSVQILRKDAGGLICVAVCDEIANALGLPLLRDLLKLHANNLEAIYTKPLPYDEKSSFSISINHVNTFTGISDRDRALTISSFGRLCRDFWSGKIDAKKLRESFMNEFRSPGHVFLLRAANGLVLERVGHTELSIALARLGDLTPCTVIAEMLGDDGNSLRLEDAKEYARRHDLVLLTGEEIVNAYRRRFSSE
ncbi:MAG: 3,4-dihydroxy-2-butanone-4-phosphate synthase [Crenarchaeota archaeon]|nr:3,4-dihydroxy-2-butanone-4-phosphate synthase [Thermoproteota archaeon]MCR8455184.1 3,4-dihydroxy-2-butanone-4-phosphate synthase [Thermoproteota archaeon]